MATTRIGNSRRETNQLALLMFEAIRECPEQDRRLILNTLRAGSNLEGGRVQMIRAAVERFEFDLDTPISKQKYERWRVAQDDPSIPSATQITNAFGNSWTKAMDAIGRAASLNHQAFRLRSMGSTVSDDQALSDLRRCADDLGNQSLRFKDYREWALKKQPAMPAGTVLLISSGSFSRRFGSFTQALQLAGIRSERSRLGRWAGQDHYTDENSIRCLRRATEDVRPASALTQEEYQSWRKSQIEAADKAGNWLVIPSFHTVRRSFGSWLKALLAADLISEAFANQGARGRGRRMAPEQIAEGLLRAVEDLGSSFTGASYSRWREAEVCDLSLPRPASQSLIRSSFDGWSEVLGAIESAMSAPDPKSTLAGTIRRKNPND